MLVWWASDVECASALSRLERDGAMTAKAASTALHCLSELNEVLARGPAHRKRAADHTASDAEPPAAGWQRPPGRCCRGGRRGRSRFLGGRFLGRPRAGRSPTRGICRHRRARDLPVGARIRCMRFPLSRHIGGSQMMRTVFVDDNRVGCATRCRRCPECSGRRANSGPTRGQLGANSGLTPASASGIQMLTPEIPSAARHCHSRIGRPRRPRRRSRRPACRQPALQTREKSEEPVGLPCSVAGRCGERKQHAGGLEQRDGLVDGGLGPASGDDARGD